MTRPDLPVKMLQHDPVRIILRREALHNKCIKWRIGWRRDDSCEIFISNPSQKCSCICRDAGGRSSLQRTGERAVHSIEELMLCDANGFAVETSFKLTPPAKPDVRSEGKQS